MKRFVLAVIMTSAVGTTAWADEPPSPPAARPQPARRGPRLPSGATEIRDLAYAQDSAAQKLDLYLPAKADGKLPLVVWIHGGGWSAGDKRGGPWTPLLEKGYAVASINYRLTGEAIFPAQIHDCKAAVRFLRANAAKYKLDPDHIGVWGSSAGGHLVALMGTSGGVDALEGKVGGNLDQSSRVQAVCDWFGPTDLVRMQEQAIPGAKMDHNAPNSPESRLIGGPIQGNKEKAAKANPIEYVDKNDPPFLIMHGDKDPLVAPGQSELLRDALKKADVPVELHVVPNAGHGFGGQELTDKVVAFFDKHLKPAAKPS